MREKDRLVFESQAFKIKGKKCEILLPGRDHKPLKSRRRDARCEFPSGDHGMKSIFLHPHADQNIRSILVRRPDG